MTQSRADAPESRQAVRLRGVGRRFGPDWALAHIDLDVAAGEVVLLAGPNGSGKTTLLRVIAGLSAPTRGEVRLFGSDPAEHRVALRRRLSLVAHQSYLYPRLTARETVVLWSRLLGWPGEADAVDRHLAEVGLEAAADHEVSGFSAGMQKRLSLVRARLEDPQLLLLDEPFTALDQDGRQLVGRWIGRFRRQGDRGHDRFARARGRRAAGRPCGAVRARPDRVGGGRR